MKSARNRGQAFRKKARFSAGTMRLGAYVCVCTGSGRLPTTTSATRGRGRRRRNPQDDKDDRARICPRERRREPRSNPILFLADARDDEEREKKNRGSSRYRRRAIEREAGAAAEYDRGRGDRRGAAAATIEREPTGAAAAAIEREGEESEAASSARSLGSRFPRLRSIPPPSLASLFPSSPPPRRQPEPPHRAVLRAPLLVVPLLLGPACAPLSISLSPVAASRSDSRADCPLYPGDSPLFSRPLPFSLSPCRLAFLHVQQDVAAISERGRVYIRAD